MLKAYSAMAPEIVRGREKTFVTRQIFRTLLLTDLLHDDRQHRVIIDQKLAVTVEDGQRWRRASSFHDELVGGSDANDADGIGRN